jgi:hypothetical protein
VSDPRQVFEGLRRVRNPEPYELENGQKIYIKGLNTFERLQFSDYVAKMREEETGEQESSFRIAAHVTYLGVVNESGERAFVSIDDVIKVFGDIEGDGLAMVFTVAQAILDRSGLAAKSAETAEKN